MLTLKTENIEKSQNCINLILPVDLLVKSTPAALDDFIPFFKNKILINKCIIILVKVKLCLTHILHKFCQTQPIQLGINVNGFPPNLITCPYILNVN